MKRKFKYLTILLLLFLCSCTAEYNLNISNNEIEEDFSSAIYMDEFSNDNNSQFDIEKDDQLTPFIEQDQYPFPNNDEIVYNKTIKEEDEYRLVNFKYSYSLSDYKKSQVLKKCFEKYKYDYSDNIKFKATGAFYCLYSEELNINITTKNKVLSNNADIVDGNTYTWNINSNNVSNIDINIEIERNSAVKTFNRYGYLIIIATVIVIISIVLLVIIVKKRQNNKF